MCAFGVGNAKTSAILAGTRQSNIIVTVVIAIELPFDVTLARIPNLLAFTC
jgi:hypothetical protein